MVSKYLKFCSEVPASWHTDWQHSWRVPCPFAGPWGCKRFDIQQDSIQTLHGACANSSREMPPLPSLSILLNISPPATSGKFHCSVQIIPSLGHPITNKTPNHGLTGPTCAEFMGGMGWEGTPCGQKKW